MTLADPHKEQYFGVQLSFGGTNLPDPDPGNFDDVPSYVRLTDITSDKTINAEVYSSVPTMEIKFGKNSGSLEETPTEIDVPRSAIPDELTSGIHAPVDVLIYEQTDGDSGIERLIPFRGKIFRTIRDIDGHQGTDRLVCYTSKKQYRTKLGFPADHQCVNALFGPGCRSNQGGGPAIADNISSATITGISGCSVDVESLLDKGTANGDIWGQGYLEYRGLRIKIRGWDKTNTTPNGAEVDTTFEMVREPPASWLNAIVRVVTGCPKFVEECRLRYDNEDNFTGPGFAILPYNPILESSS